MRFLGVHPGPLLYTKVFLRLEPLGLELVAQAVRRAGHEVRLIDLQVEDHRAYFRLLRQLAARCRRVFLQLPGERPRDRRSRQGDQGAVSGDLCLRRRAQRLVHRERHHRARGRRDRLRAQGRGRGGDAAAACRNRGGNGHRHRFPVRSPRREKGRRPALSTRSTI